MHTVIETPAYLSAAKAAKMTVAEMTAVVDAIAADPMLGAEMRGTGGCRKVRFAKGGRGKSGGVRVITFHTGPALPVFLLTVFGKGEKANLTKSESNALAKLTKVLTETYATKVVTMEKRR